MNDINPDEMQPSAALVSPLNTGDEGEVTAPDLTPPDAPTDLQFTYDGRSISGKGEVGAYVYVYDPSNQSSGPIGDSVVDSSGNFVVTLNRAYKNSEQLSVALVDSSGNESDHGEVTAPDLTPPNAPDIDNFTKSGDVITGRGEPGATLTVLDEEGNELYSLVVGEDGQFTVPFDPPLQLGELVEFYLTDPAGNRSASSYARAHIIKPEPEDCSECEDALQKLREENAYLKGKLSCCTKKPSANVYFCFPGFNHLNGHGFVNGVFRGHGSIYRRVGFLV